MLGLLSRLDNISDLCLKKRINLATKDNSPIQNIIAFQKKIQDQLKLTQGRAELSSTLLKSPEPSKRSRSARGGQDGADDVSSPRSGILETPMSSVAAMDRDVSDAGAFRLVQAAEFTYLMCSPLSFTSLVPALNLAFHSEDESELPTQSSSRSGGKGKKGSSSGRKSSVKGFVTPSHFRTAESVFDINLEQESQSEKWRMRRMKKALLVLSVQSECAAFKQSK